MKKTKLQLQTFLYIVLGIIILIIGLYETDTLSSGVLSSEKQAEFLLTTFMELLTLACVYLSLRMFKFEKVHKDLIERKADALRLWGGIRLALLLIPMLTNTILYYMFMNPTFGYMAIIQALCLPFVFPSEGRCLAETES